eukprot:Amastigsp_a352657_26.p3 type:complete len:122 gc:universal Amastigsp_a352657_26:75-440(+)
MSTSSVIISSLTLMLRNSSSTYLASLSDRTSGTNGGGTSFATRALNERSANHGCSRISSASRGPPPRRWTGSLAVRPRRHEPACSENSSGTESSSRMMRMNTAFVPSPSRASNGGTPHIIS